LGRMIIRDARIEARQLPLTDRQLWTVEHR
jgi:hypothetical protein